MAINHMTYKERLNIYTEILTKLDKIDISEDNEPAYKVLILLLHNYVNNGTQCHTELKWKKMGPKKFIVHLYNQKGKNDKVYVTNCYEQ